MKSTSSSRTASSQACATILIALFAALSTALRRDSAGGASDFGSVAHLISRKAFNRELEPRHRALLVHLVDRASKVKLEAAGCWENPPGPEAIAAFALLGSNNDSGSTPSRWTRTATNGPLPQGVNLQGMPITLTYSFVPDGITTVASSPFNEPTASSNLIQTFNALFGSTAAWQQHFHDVFARWGILSGVTYVFEPNDDGAPIDGTENQPGVLGVRGDIRISGKNIDGSSGFNLLAYNYFPDVGEMVIDTTNTLFFGNPASNSRALRNVVAHEHGHGLGMNHVCPANFTKLMEPVFNTTYDGPQYDDVRNAQRRYGDRYEPNDSTTDPASLGTLPPGSTTTVADASTDDESDVDLYRFFVMGPSRIDVALTPTGASYPLGPELPGLCVGSITGTLSISDLSLSVIDADGVSVLASANVNPAGVSEQLSCVGLPSGNGPYYVRVTPDQTNDLQTYRLSITVASSVLHVPSEYASISAAIAAACSDDIILVAPGSYSPFSFYGKSVKVRSVGGPSSTSLQRVYFVNQETREAVLEGFTVSNLGNGNLYGGGIYCANGAMPTIRDCLIVDSTSNYGGGVGCVGGSAPLIERCVIRGNCAGGPTTVLSNGRGGGVYAYESHPILVSCVIAQNVAYGIGGGIACDTVGLNPPGAVTLINCTIADNESTLGGGFFAYPNSRLDNCIVSGNVPDEINGNPVVSFSMISGGVSPGQVWPGVGNFDANPYFIAAGDYHLGACSACVNGGSSAIAGLPLFDLDGESRIQGGGVDVGADESPMTECAYPGTFEDLVLLTGVGGPPGPLEIKFAAPGNYITIMLRSPGGSFVAEPFVLAAQPIVTGMAPPNPYPAVYIGTQGAIVIAGSPPFGPLGMPLLSPAGFGLALLTPAGLAGLSIVIQGAAITPSAVNSIFASTNGHEIRFLP